MDAKKYKALRGQLRRTLQPMWNEYYRLGAGFMITDEQIAYYHHFDKALQDAAARLRCSRSQVARMILHI